jgi:hypothetical protein
MTKLLIGIDPGIHTGFAVKRTDKNEFAELSTYTFWEAIDRIKFYLSNFYPPTKIIIEDPNLNRPTFHSKVKGEKRRENISQKVGMNKRDAQLIIEYCELWGIEVHRVKPSKHSGVNLTHYHFQMMTKYSGRTNQHMRDAGMLIWGL